MFEEKIDSSIVVNDFEVLEEVKKCRHYYDAPGVNVYSRKLMIDGEMQAFLAMTINQVNGDLFFWVNGKYNPKCLAFFSLSLHYFLRDFNVLSLSSKVSIYDEVELVVLRKLKFSRSLANINGVIEFYTKKEIFYRQWVF